MNIYEHVIYINPLFHVLQFSDLGGLWTTRIAKKISTYEYNSPCRSLYFRLATYHCAMLFIVYTILRLDDNNMRGCACSSKLVNKNTCIFISREHHNNKPLKRLRFNSEYNIKTDLSHTFKHIDWIRRIQGGVQWRALSEHLLCNPKGWEFSPWKPRHASLDLQDVSSFPLFWRWHTSLLLSSSASLSVIVWPHLHSTSQ
jgi:hypothetical protein